METESISNYEDPVALQGSNKKLESQVLITYTPPVGIISFQGHETNLRGKIFTSRNRFLDSQRNLLHGRLQSYFPTSLSITSTISLSAFSLISLANQQFITSLTKFVLRHKHKQIT
jgi:hypothetical protein